jgi:uncharacterized protein (DUF362 family)/Pyruvate/2-oxoacid:ferredoxin oxidoreductase delta subunit
MSDVQTAVPSARRATPLSARSRVALVRCPDYEPVRLKSSIRQALDLLGGLPPAIGPQSRVFLKPNVMMPKPLGFPCNTHPEFVRAVVEIVRERGAAVTVGESAAGSQAGLTFTGRALRQSGIEDAAREAGAEVLNLDHGAVVETALPNPIAPLIPIAKPALDTDLLVLLPKFKTHAFANILTGAVKLCYGTVPGQIKAEFHRRAPQPEPFFSVIRDLYGALAPGLAVFDAVEAMEGDGPSAGNPRALGFIIASFDPVAADAVAAALIGLDPLRVMTTRLCDAAGLGHGRLADIDIVGADLAGALVRDFKLPKTAVPPAFLYRFLLGLTPTEPHIDPKICTLCRTCSSSCPMGAMSIKSERMTIDRSLCIRCFCCSEVCPSQAIKPKHRSRLGRLIGKVISSRW